MPVPKVIPLDPVPTEVEIDLGCSYITGKLPFGSCIIMHDEVKVSFADDGSTITIEGDTQVDHALTDGKLTLSVVPAGPVPPLDPGRLIGVMVIGGPPPLSGLPLDAESLFGEPTNLGDLFGYPRSPRS